MLAPAKSTWIIAVLALASIFPPLATDMYLPALGAMANDLNTTAAAAEFSLSVFFLGLGVGQLILGPLIDAYGRKLPLLIGISIFILTSIALVFTDNIILFNILRFLQALGACGGMVISRAIISDIYTGQDAAKNLTILVMLMTVGPILSPTIGSLLFAGLGWRSIFVVLVMIGIIAFVLVKQAVPETLAPEKRVAQPFRSAAKNAKLLIGNPRFILPTLVANLAQAAMFAFITGSSGVFQGIYGLDALDYGFAFALIAISLLVYGQINKKLLNILQPTQILSRGLPIYALMGLLCLLMVGTPHLWAFMLPLWLSIGFVSLVSANAIALAMSAAKASAGTGSALIGVFQFSMAFTVSSLVAWGGTHSALPMSLGIFIPALCAMALWWLTPSLFKQFQ